MPTSSNPRGSKGPRAATRKEIRGARRSGELPKRRTMYHAQYKGAQMRNAVIARGYGGQLADKAAVMTAGEVLRKKGFSVRDTGGGGFQIKGTAKSRAMAGGKRRGGGGGRRQRRDRHGKFA